MILFPKKISLSLLVLVFALLPGLSRGQQLSYEEQIAAAKNSLSAGDFRVARLLCADAMILDITRPEAYLYTAIALYKEDELDMAQEFISKGMAYCNADQKQFAETILEGIADKRRFNRYMEEGQKHLGNKDAGKAADSYHTAWKLFPVRTDAAFQAVDLYIGLKKFPEAMEILSTLKKYPDPSVSKAASSLYSTLDETPQIRNKKAYEKCLAKGNLSMEKGYYNDALEAYRDGLNYKSGDRELLQKIEVAKEEIAYEKARNSNYVEQSEEYADKYPFGKYISTVESTLKKSYRSIARKHYDAGDESGLFKFYRKYQQRFPHDSEGIEPVKSLLGQYYYRTAETSYDVKSWEQAKQYYQSYLSLYRSGEKALHAQKRIKRCEFRIKQVSSSFIIYTYETNSPIGLSFGDINKDGPGLYMNLKMNAEVFTSFDVLYEIDNAGNHDHPGPVTRTGASREGNVALSAGITFKLAYPLWGYIGGGAGYYPVYEQADTYYSSGGDFWKKKWLKNTDLTTFGFFPEAGVKLKVLNTFVLKYGVVYTKGITHQFGFGFPIAK
jgi:tetratricopeptide (TPR) repeat protein